MMRFSPSTTLLVAAGSSLALAGALGAQQDETVPPLRLRATVMIVDALPPGTSQLAMGGSGAGGSPFAAPGMPGQPPAALAPATANGPAVTRSTTKASGALLSITIDRWSMDDERAALVQSMKSGGPYALVSLMDKTTVGYLQVNDGLRLPIRMVSSWKTDRGQVIRLATSRPILDGSSAQASRGTDNSIGIINLTLPASGSGEGTLVAATRAAFDDQGQIEARVLALNSGVERVTNVERVESDKGAGPGSKAP